MLHNIKGIDRLKQQIAVSQYCQNCPHTMWDHMMAHVSEHCRGKEMDGAVEYDCPCQGYLKKGG